MTAKYEVVESCMLPSGAWTKTLRVFDAADQAKAVEFYRTVTFQGPKKSGIRRRSIQIHFMHPGLGFFRMMNERFLD